MKILHLLYESKGDYFGIGGAGIRCYEIYGRLKQRHDITLLCKRYPGACNREIEGLRHVFTGAESQSLLKTLLAYSAGAVKYVREKGEEFDVIIEDFSPAIPTFLHAVTRRPCVLQIQGYTGMHYFRKYNHFYGFVLWGLERMRPGRYPNVIAINNQIVHKLCRRVSGFVEVIPNGIPCSLLDSPTGEGRYMLYLGRIDIYSKGLDLLIDAYRDFFTYYQKIPLVIAGDGKDMEEFRRRLGALPPEVQNNIKLKGWVSGEEKTEVIRNALFAVMPSRHEVQGISALEALVFQKPVAVSDIPELSYIVENKAGLSFESENPMAFCRIMRRLVENREERRLMGKNGRAWVEGHTWEEIALQYENFLSRVVESAHD